MNTLVLTVIYSTRAFGARWRARARALVLVFRIERGRVRAPDRRARAPSSKESCGFWMVVCLRYRLFSNFRFI